MPHDAISVDDLRMDNVRTHAVHTVGYDPGWSTFANQGLLYRSMLKMPASTNNPKRDDGTRAPSAFWTKRALIQARPYQLSQENPGTGVYWGYYTKESTAAYVLPSEMSVDSDTLLNWALAGPLIRTNVDALARTKFLNNLSERSGKDQVELGVAAGELRETIGLVEELGQATIKAISSTAKAVGRAPGTIAKALYHLKQAGPKEIARRFFNGDTAALERVIQAWLVYQLGLKPLAYDVYDAEVYLRSQVDQDYYHLDVVVRGGASDVIDVELSHNTWGVNGGTYFISGLYRQSVGIHYACKYRIPTQANTAQQLGVNNPAYVAWNLARFTWVVDKVVDIGNWLHSFMAPQGTSFIEGTKSEIRRTSLLRLVDKTQDQLGWGALSGLNPDNPPLVQVEHFNRDVLTVGVMPSFMPGVKNTMGLVQLASTIAALTTLSASRVKWPNPGII